MEVVRGKYEVPLYSAQQELQNKYTIEYYDEYDNEYDNDYDNDLQTRH